MFRLLAVLVSILFAPVVLGVQPIELKPGSFVRLTGEIDDTVASKFIQDLTKSPDGEIFVYIDSPGGDVLAGVRMIDAVTGLKAFRPGLTLTCFAQNAASMAFIFLQTSCDRRVVSVFSVLMQHQASVGLRGKVGEVDSRFSLVMQVVSLLERAVAKRLELSDKEYKDKVVNDWWLVGQVAIDNKAADSVAIVACSAELAERKECPLAYALP